jgi:hypothetical protein
MASFFWLIWGPLVILCFMLLPWPASFLACLIILGFGIAWIVNS